MILRIIRTAQLSTSYHSDRYNSLLTYNIAAIKIETNILPLSSWLVSTYIVV